MDIFFTVLRVFIQALTFAIFIRAILTWIIPGQSNFLTDILYHVTEPILSPIRRIMPQAQGLDFSPTVAIIVLMIISWIIP